MQEDLSYRKDKCENISKILLYDTKSPPAMIYFLNPFILKYHYWSIFGVGEGDCEFGCCNTRGCFGRFRVVCLRGLVGGNVAGGWLIVLKFQRAWVGTN